MAVRASGRPRRSPSDGEASDGLDVDGHRVRVTNLDKVMYPETGTTKGEVIDYYLAIAATMVPHVTGRPATRKRWVHGVAGEVFFEKNLAQGAPDWVARQEVQHKDHRNTYPVVTGAATLVWLAQAAALEVHVPQWRFGPDGERSNPDRLVLDLDPGPGAGLPQCVEVALALREILTGMGLEPFPVTSGSKGIHLYAPLDGRQTSDQVSTVAHELARALEADHPDLVVSDMKKTLRTGKVLVDWSQNSAAKTTVAPYSLRGRAQPWVAAPRTWRELTHPGLRQLDHREVLARVRRRGDPMAGASDGPASGGEDADDEHHAADRHGTTSTRRPPDTLDAYRSKRHRDRTPEPVPGRGPRSRAGGRGNTFVVHEHHARRLHWDFRLEHDGALVSWALPKGEPTDPAHNHLAVQTEDHPLSYGSFEGTIPSGEYGAGTVSIWDAGTYEVEKWSDHEVIVVLRGERHGERRLALIRTRLGRGDERPGPATGAGPVRSQWLIHLMALEPEHAPQPSASGPPASEQPTSSMPTSPPTEVARGSRTADRAGAGRGGRAGAERRPMLATLGRRSDVTPEQERGAWAFEMKWDGIRAIARVAGTTVTLTSRNGSDLAVTYPEIVEALAGAVEGDAVLDGEIVALDRGAPSFGRLQQRMNLSSPRAVARAREAVPVELYLFDVLEVAGVPVIDETYRRRRERLRGLVADGPRIKVPPEFDGDFDGAWRASARLRLEGVLAKRLESRYQPGKRSADWIKVKHHLAGEVVVVGWRPGRAGLRGTVGSLLLAVHRGDHLEYAGRVGTGFSSADRDAALTRLRPLRRRTPGVVGVPTSDAADAVWVTPSQVGEVEHAGWTSDGRLRQARWRGWRPDKEAADVVAGPLGA